MDSYNNNHWTAVYNDKYNRRTTKDGLAPVSAAATADLNEGHSQTPSQGPVLGLILRVGTDTALAIQRHPESDKASSGEPWNIGLDDSTMPPVSETGSSSASVQSANQMTEDISIAQRMVSATCGSILTSLLVTPLDVVRVRLQSQSSTRNNTSPYTSHSFQTLKNAPPNLGVTACCREVFWIGQNSELCMVGPGSGALGNNPATMECAVEETQRRTFTSTLDGLRKIARNEGTSTLWRGLSPTLMMGIPANIIYFAGYDWLRSDDRSPIKQSFPDVYTPFVAGTVARIAAASAISPIEMFRTRLQATSGSGAGHFKTTLEDLYHMTQTTGYSSLWRGLTLTMWRDVPFSGLYWWGYEEVKKRLIDARKSTQENILSHSVSSTAHQISQDADTPTFLDSFIAGATSGSLSAFVTTPFDVGKTRQQVFRHMGDDLHRSGIDGRTSARPEQLSLPKFLMHIFRDEGMAGLFRGWVARCLKVAPACAIMISTYEFGKKMARGVNERRHSSSEEGSESDNS